MIFGDHFLTVKLCFFRWFDKSFSLLLTKGAHAAVNFEHAWGDGVAVLRYFNEVYKDKKFNTQGCQATMEGVANLDFHLTPNLKSAIEKARSSVEENCNSLSTNIMQYQKYGKKEIKKFQMSPDAIMQLAFQVSQRMNKESCSFVSKLYPSHCHCAKLEI